MMDEQSVNENEFVPEVSKWGLYLNTNEYKLASIPWHIRCYSKHPYLTEAHYSPNDQVYSILEPSVLDHA